MGHLYKLKELQYRHKSLDFRVFLRTYDYLFHNLSTKFDLPCSDTVAYKFLKYETSEHVNNYFSLFGALLRQIITRKINRLYQNSRTSTMSIIFLDLMRFNFKLGTRA